MKFPKVEKPYIAEPINWTKWKDRLIGFDVWAEKNKREFLKREYDKRQH